MVKTHVSSEGKITSTGGSEVWTRNTAPHRTASPTHYWLSYSDPLLSSTTETLNEDQGYPNWYTNVESNLLCHHTKFELNWFLNIWMQANVECFRGWNHIIGALSLEYWSDKIKMSTIAGAVFAFSNPGTLNQDQGHPNWSQTKEEFNILYHTKSINKY